MNIGKLLMSGANLYSPWLDREADNAVFQYEVIQANNGATLTVEVWHKNSEDTGEGSENTPAEAFAQIGSSGVYETTFTSLKEMVRFKFSVSATDDVSGEVDSSSGPGIYQLQAGAVSWLEYRMLEPTWYDKA